jgi:hypothetical protein
MLVRRLTLGFALVAAPLMFAKSAGAFAQTDTTTTAVQQRVEQQADALMKQGRAALIRGDNDLAVRLFSQLLKLPPNSYSQDAQEFIGLAKERNGQTAAARQEYELYLRLYPTGPDADRVRQRLATLSTTVAPAAMRPAKTVSTQSTTYGSLLQYYYHGRSQIDTTFAPPGTTIPNESTVVRPDQSALVSNFDITSRYRGERYDSRAVFRAMDMHSFLDTVPSRDRLNAAYLDVRDREWDAAARLGRQPGNSGGVLGYFDGALLGYGVTPKWRINVVGGKPVDFYTHYDKTFYGANMELGPFLDRWSANLYGIKQEVEGMTDRQAVGSELRYFDETKSLFTLVDYDTVFSAVGIAMLQANWQLPGKNSLSLLADHRRSPTLQATNALLGETNATMATLRQTLSEDEIRQQALARTATADAGVVGLAHEFNARWQLRGEVALSRIGATQASGTVPATPGTGNILTYTMQLLGAGLFASQDVSIISASYIDAATYNGDSVALSDRAILQRWTLESTVRFYQQHDNVGTRLTRVVPSFRAAYRWRDNLTFEAEAGIEKTKTEGTMQQEDTTRQFYSVGYRWDFGG